MKLYVARHGRTNYNDLGLSNSDPKTDVHLTKIGTEQAEALAARLKDVAIEHIFVSELKRTKQTADIVNKYHNAPTTTDGRLNDVRTGFEDKHFLEYHAALNKADDKWTVRFNDGESLEDVKKRVQSFLDTLKTKEFQSVLVVTSEVVIQAIYGILNNRSGADAWDFPVEQGSCVEFEL